VKRFNSEEAAIFFQGRQPCSVARVTSSQQVIKLCVKLQQTENAQMLLNMAAFPAVDINDSAKVF
jgi:hypothetical protein